MLLVAHRTPSTRTECAEFAAAGATVFEADIQVDDGERIVVSHFLPFVGLQRDNWRIRRRSSAVRDPELAAVAAIVPDDCLILLDLKEQRPDRRARLVTALIEQAPHRARFRVCGGHLDDLAELRTAGFRTWRTVRNGRELRHLLASDGLPDDAVSVRHTILGPAVVDQLHERVRTVVAWTVNDLSRARRLRAMGVDGVTTDRLPLIHAMSSIAN